MKTFGAALVGNQRTLPRTKLPQQLKKHSGRLAFRVEEERRQRLVGALRKAHNTYMDSAAILKRLRRDGWQLVRVNGSHHHFRRGPGDGLVTVKHPLRDLPVGTLRNIYRQAGWKWSDKKGS